MTPDMCRSPLTVRFFSFPSSLRVSPCLTNRCQDADCPHRSVKDGEGTRGAKASRVLVVPHGVACPQSEVTLAPRLLSDRLTLPTAHLSGDDRRTNPSPTLPVRASCSF